MRNQGGIVKSQMKKRLLDLWERVGAKGDGNRVYAELAANYGELHRAYHTLAHIEHCLDEFEHVRHLAKNPDSIEMALWFHDVIYDTKAKDNEEKSAELAQDVARSAGLSAQFGKKVIDLIRATTHQEVLSDPDAQLIVDIDLSALGLPATVFDENTAKIRKEYAWVPEDAFVTGRSKILKSFLRRKHIYVTKFFRKKYEARARRNILRYLARVNQCP